MRLSVLRFAMFALAALFAAVAALAAQPATRGAPPSLKAGYAFDPAFVSGGVTNTFAIDASTDHLDVSSISDGRVSRRLQIVRNPGPGEDRVQVEIGVSQGPDPLAMVGDFVTEAFMAVEAGDQFFSVVPSLGSFGRINDAGNTVLFTNANIYIMLEQVAGAPVSLPQMAQEIYSQISLLPTVSSLPLPTDSLTTFPVPGVTNLSEGQQQEFTVSEFDPSGGPLTRTYVAPDGEVILTGPNPVYKADSTVGAQTLQLVVTTPSLLSGAATLVFNVTP